MSPTGSLTSPWSVTGVVDVGAGVGPLQEYRGTSNARTTNNRRVVAPHLLIVTLSKRSSPATAEFVPELLVER